MLAAGGAVDPFWGMYQQHNTPAVRAMLEPYRIGRLKGGAGAAKASAQAEGGGQGAGVGRRGEVAGAALRLRSHTHAHSRRPFASPAFTLSSLHPLSAPQVVDPYASEPTDRLPALVVRSDKPMNAGRGGWDGCAAGWQGRMQRRSRAGGPPHTRAPTHHKHIRTRTHARPLCTRLAASLCRDAL